MPARYLAPALVAVTITLAACQSDGRVRTEAPATGDADATVSLADHRFEPAEVTVDVGDTVAWRWNDGKIDHDVAFDDGPASPLQDEGSWQRRFDSAGTYRYVCTLHDAMRGTVVVRPGS